MCITLPAKIKKIKNQKIITEEDGRQKEVRGSLIRVKVGDYVILQNNFIVGKITKKEAKEIINLIKK
ncbi:MAG: hydrogenase assembly protein HupF [Parcubacteria group bacterium CG_4_9_14_0_2_um_filter_35_11]|nr:MAG: hydrogenase assembly protein HupF [Parcubacteria group bacterium CG_4_9_14_0_2_um_filter_35_11]